MTSYDKMLNANDVAQILQIGRNAVYGLAKSGELKSYRMGRKLLFTLADVNEYFDSKCCPSGGAGIAYGAGAAFGASGVGVVGGGVGVVGGVAGAAGVAGMVGAASAAGANALASDIDGALSPLLNDKPALIVAGEGTVCSTALGLLQDAGVSMVHYPMCDYAALASLYSGKSQAAIASLYDQRANSCNIPYVQRMVPGTPLVIIRLVSQMVGLVVAEGNPKKVTSVGSLLRHDHKLVNRPKGSMERVFFDAKCVAIEGNPQMVKGYDTEVATAFDAATLVSQGVADACIANEHVARMVPGVNFVPMQKVVSDLVVLKNKQTAACLRDLKKALASPRLQKLVEKSIPCDASNMGSIVYEC